MLLNLPVRNLSTIIEKFIYICSYYYISKLGEFQIYFIPQQKINKGLKPSMI